MNTVNIDRLTATLSDILSAKYGRQVLVTFKEGEQNDNNDSCRPGSDSGRSARIPTVRNAV